MNRNSSISLASLYFFYYHNIVLTAFLIDIFHPLKLRLCTLTRQKQGTNKIRSLYFIAHTWYYHSEGKLDQSVASIGICQSRSSITELLRHNERCVRGKWRCFSVTIDLSTFPISHYTMFLLFTQSVHKHPLQNPWHNNCLVSLFSVICFRVALSLSGHLHSIKLWYSNQGPSYVAWMGENRNNSEVGNPQGSISF